MLEIDGEFFEDPCENVRAGKQLIALLMAQSSMTQIALMLAQPLFPKFAEGGIIDPATHKGDIVYVK